MRQDSASEPNRKSRNQPKVHVTRDGHRYVDPDDMFDDPAVRKRLEQADKIAVRLGIKASG